jgi:hypothetical protein
MNPTPRVRATSSPSAGGPVYVAFAHMNGTVDAMKFFNPLFDEVWARLP